MRRRWLASSAALLALCGCAQVLGIEEGTDSPWFCNAHVAVPSGKTSYDFHFVDDQLQPLTPAPVTLCAQSDPTCASPTPLTVTDGTLDLRLPASNDGYLDLPVPVGWSTIVELGPAGNVVPTERTFPVFSTIDVNVFKVTDGLVQDGANGALIVAAYDCNEMPAAGVEIAVAIEGRTVMTSPVYLGGDYRGATVVTGASTSSAGIGLVTNVTPSDAATVTLTRASDQVVVATALVHIRATTITELYLGPTKTQ